MNEESLKLFYSLAHIDPLKLTEEQKNQLEEILSDGKIISEIRRHLAQLLRTFPSYYFSVQNHDKLKKEFQNFSEEELVKLSHRQDGGAVGSVSFAAGSVLTDRYDNLVHAST